MSRSRSSRRCHPPKTPSSNGGRFRTSRRSLKPLYDAEPDRLFWFDAAAPAARLETTLAALAAAGDHGLDPADYDAAALADQWASLKAGVGSGADRALLDLGLSVAIARIGKAVSVGRVDPATMHWGYENKAKQVDLPGLLREARDGRGLAAAMEAIAPKVTHYARARQTLALYKEKARAGEPDPVPTLAKGQTKIESGKSWTGVSQVAARLRAFGDLGADAPPAGAIYGGAIVEAIKRFQARHGLENDGVIGAGTIKALNVSIADRVRQIELAMERMRWLPALDTRPNVFVNVALFRLWATDPATGNEPLRMNVVVGKSLNHQTPIFVEQMEYVVFRPYWNPPRGIVMKEILPHGRRDGLLRQGGSGDRRERRRQRDGAAADAGEPGEGRGGPPARPPAAGPAQLARPGQVHLSERRRHLHARHARAAVVLTRAARFQSRLHPAGGSGTVRGVGAARSAGMDPAAYRRRNAGEPSDEGEPQAAAHRRALLRHGARQFRGRAVLR